MARMVSKNDKLPSLTGTLLGLLLDPRTTLERLLLEPKPPYLLRIVGLLLIVAFAPFLYQLWKLNFGHYFIQLAGALFAHIITMIALFIALEVVLFLLFGIECGAQKVSAVVIYSLAPLLMAISILYISNVSSAGSVSIVELFFRGGHPPTNAFLRFLPLALAITQISVIVVFFLGVRTAGNVHSITALCLSVLSLFPLMVAFTGGLLVAEVVYPGAIDVVTSFFSDPKAFLSHSGLFYH